MNTRSYRARAVLLSALLFVLAACEAQPIRKREAGALGGGALGAGLGAIIGNQVGNQGAAIAIGGALGAVSGALIGNEFDNREAELGQTESRIAEQERRLEENRRLIEELKRRGTDVRSTERGVVVNLPDVLFEFDRSELTRDARATVGEIAQVLRSAPNRRISVEGHTDSTGTVPYNQRLSEDRARSVARELVNDGVSRGRISTRGFGETEPIASNATAGGRQRNRRVEVIIEN